MRLAILGQAKYPPRSITLLYFCPKEMPVEPQNSRGPTAPLPPRSLHGLQLLEHRLPEPYQNYTLCSMRNTVIKYKPMFSLMQTTRIRAAQGFNVCPSSSIRQIPLHHHVSILIRIAKVGNLAPGLCYTWHKWFKNSKPAPCSDVAKLRCLHVSKRQILTRTDVMGTPNRPAYIDLQWWAVVGT